MHIRETCPATAGRTSHRGIARALLAVSTLVVSLAMSPAASAEGRIELTSSVERLVRETAADGSVGTRLEPAERVVPGDELRYTITFENTGDAPVDAGSVVVTNPLPESTEYIADSAIGAGTEITYSVDGGLSFGAPGRLRIVTPEGERAATSADYTTIRWRFGPELAPGERSHVAFRVRLK